MVKMRKSVEESAHGARGCFDVFQRDVLEKWKGRARFFFERRPPTVSAL
jgi:hypothetical protein